MIEHDQKPTPTEDDLSKPVYRSWTKLGTVATIIGALAVVGSGIVVILKVGEARGVAQQTKADTDQKIGELSSTVSDHGRILEDVKIGQQSTSDSIQFLKEIATDIKTDDGKIIWFLMDARKQLPQQSKAGATRPSIFASIDPPAKENDP
jgi:hypothetical protein